MYIQKSSLFFPVFVVQLSSFAHVDCLYSHPQTPGADLLCSNVGIFGTLMNSVKV